MEILAYVFANALRLEQHLKRAPGRSVSGVLIRPRRRRRSPTDSERRTSVATARRTVPIVQRCATELSRASSRFPEGQSCGLLVGAVAPGAAGELVFAHAAGEVVVARAAEELVGAGLSEEG
jgi:hypothetical protein